MALDSNSVETKAKSDGSPDLSKSPDAGNPGGGHDAVKHVTDHPERACSLMQSLQDRNLPAEP